VSPVPDKPSSAYSDLAKREGVAGDYIDAWHNRHSVPSETQEAVLRAMGHDDPVRSLDELSRSPWNRIIEAVMVIQAEAQPSSIPVYFPLNESNEPDTSVTCTITDETGTSFTEKHDHITVAEARTIDEVRHVRVDIPNRTDRPPGYYQLEIQVETHDCRKTGTMRLIVTPAQCHIPQERCWGITLSLYSLRSQKNWGIGDLGDLRELIRWAANELGAGFVGISPLHAITNKGTSGISPYLPLSRLYHNFIYLDMESVLSESDEGRELLSSAEVIDETARLRSLELIDYEAVAFLKYRALKTSYNAFITHHLMPGSPEAESFKAYIKDQGRPLDNFATFMAIGEQKGFDSRAEDWSEMSSPETEAVNLFRQGHAGDIQFHKYVQWLIDRQLHEVSQASQHMSVGLYTDLAVGSAPGGSDAWSNPDVFVKGVDTGVPPDSFNNNGQNWSFPPLSPERLRETGYEAFIQTIRHNLTHAGALRIDHALGLFRLFWIPEGTPSIEGTYVQYPSEELLGIIALESMRHRALIIAEDLGTIGDEVREGLRRYGMLSYRLLYFERDRHPMRYRLPHEYRDMAITAVNTHDLPTLAGFWEAHDIDVRSGLGLSGSAQDEESEREFRRETIGHMLDALREALPGDVPDGTPPVDDKMMLAIHRFLAMTPSRLVAVSLDDALGQKDQQNLPGVIEAHPNWRRKYPIVLEEVFRSGLLQALAGIFQASGRANENL
jgi:4-alpha-glucanotransferase